MSLRQVFFFICLIGLFSCSKEKSPEQTAESVKSSLTSGVTKTWALKKLFVNGTQSTLTPGQALYTKTYKADNTWLDSDGYAGTYTVPSPTLIIEITTNLPAGNRNDTYTIKSISVTSLEVEYSVSSTTYRLVFGL